MGMGNRITNSVFICGGLMRDTKDAIMIHMIEHGGIQDAKLTMKGYVAGHIIKSRCILQEAKQPLSNSEIEDIISYLKIAEAALIYLTDPEEGEE